MKKYILLSTLLLALTVVAHGQNRFYTKNGKVSFDATSPSSPDKIAANNDKATCVVDVSNGAMEFAILMKAFSFEKSLMQEHFNENYMESDKFPKATFKGSIENMNEVSLQKDGTYKVKVKGKMTIHGVTQDVESTGTLAVKGGALTAGKSEFKIKLADYNIEIPSLVKDKIAPEAKIVVDVIYEVLKSS
jgi:polyisoprenoid-binding protein YceI